MSTCTFCNGSGWMENTNRRECDNCHGKVCYVCENRRDVILCKWICCSNCYGSGYSESSSSLSTVESLSTVASSSSIVESLSIVASSSSTAASSS